MGHSASNKHTTMKVDGREYCAIFGHHPKRFGDGLFCTNCDEKLPADYPDNKSLNADEQQGKL